LRGERMSKVKRREEDRGCIHTLSSSEESTLKPCPMGWRCSKCGLLVYKRRFENQEERDYEAKTYERFRMQSLKFIEEIKQQKKQR